MSKASDKEKVVIAGGTGFIGNYFKKRFIQLGYDVLIVSRDGGDVHWDNEKALTDALERSAMVINLAGKTINCRHTEQNKKAILQSRIKTTQQLGEAILKCAVPPPLWINASGANIYADNRDRLMTERDGIIGKDFLAEVVQQWEKALFSIKLPNTRQVACRQGVVLGKNGGFMKPFLVLARMGLGGRQGVGTQMFSWIHIEDLFSIILFVKDNEHINGAINCASPNDVSNKELMRSIRKAVHMPVGMPTLAWMLRIGGLLIGTEPSLILTSCRAYPEKLIEAGYGFKYPAIDMALRDIVSK